MDTQNHKQESLEAIQKKAGLIIEVIEEELERTKQCIESAIDGLYDYVYKRELPYVDEGMHPADELGNMVIALGGCIDFATGHGYLGLTPSFLLEENSLQTLLNKAESYIQLDFPDYYTGDFYDQDKQALTVFSLEQLAEVSGRNLGSVRNATLKGGDLKTTRLDGVVDRNGEPVGQSVFVEYAEARKWLESKKRYEPLNEKRASVEDRMSFIRDTGPVFDGSNLPNELLLREKGELQVFYAPFEHVNSHAKVVLCGITPGAAQAEIALNTLAAGLRSGSGEEEALRAAKNAASFAGPMRESLAKMLDHVRLNNVLGINSCSSLFDGDKDLVHYTSALKNPVFYKGGNYTGNPLMLKEDALKWQIDEILAKEVQQLGEDVIYIPLGPKPADALMYLANKGLLRPEQILKGIPHPSGANAERIKYFCEEKEKGQLSSRTNAQVIDEARGRIKRQLAALSVSN